MSDIVEAIQKEYFHLYAEERHRAKAVCAVVVGVEDLRQIEEWIIAHQRILGHSPRGFGPRLTIQLFDKPVPVLCNYEADHMFAFAFAQKLRSTNSYTVDSPPAPAGQQESKPDEAGS